MYDKSAHLYDTLYRHKDYEKEVLYLRDVIATHGKTGGNRLLDVACGTGKHVFHLKHHFQTEGLDLNSALLAHATERNPDVLFHIGDMQRFSLGTTFDVVTCLFSAIGHLENTAALTEAIKSMSDHLVPGGILFIEPWIFPENFREGTLSSLIVDDPEMKIVRMSIAQREGNHSIFDLHHLVGTPSSVESFQERLQLTLFEKTEYERAYTDAGLTVHFDPIGPMGRGLFIGIKPH
ncbi:MAG: class I SAM-dependent methyltransferase [Deinococcaceae bacterium]